MEEGATVTSASRKNLCLGAVKSTVSTVGVDSKFKVSRKGLGVLAVFNRRDLRLKASPFKVLTVNDSTDSRYRNSIGSVVVDPATRGLGDAVVNIKAVYLEAKFKDSIKVSIAQG